MSSMSQGNAHYELGFVPTIIFLKTAVAFFCTVDDGNNDLKSCTYLPSANIWSCLTCISCSKYEYENKRLKLHVNITTGSTPLWP